MRSGPRRQTQWGGSALKTTEIAAPANTTILDQSFTAAVLDPDTPMTVVRTRGILSIRTDQVIATEQPFGALGFMVVNENARVAGVASLLTPYTDALAEQWFVHQYWHTGILFGDATGIQAPPFREYVFDSKAMRKVGEGEAIVILLENNSALHGATYLLDFRILFKMH